MKNEELMQVGERMKDDEMIDNETATQIAKAASTAVSPYRDERGVRIQTYRRFKEGEDYEALDEKDMVVLMDSVLDDIEAHEEAIKQGRPRKYETVDEFFEAFKNYCRYIRDGNIDGVRLVPDVEGLAGFMGISRDTLNDWERSRPGS